MQRLANKSQRQSKANDNANNLQTTTISLLENKP